MEENGAAARAVAQQIAVVNADMPETNLPQTFPLFEDPIRKWFQMLYQIDPSPELAGFRALVVEEHAAFRR